MKNNIVKFVFVVTIFRMPLLHATPEWLKGVSAAISPEARHIPAASDVGKKYWSEQEHNKVVEPDESDDFSPENCYEYDAENLNNCWLPSGEAKPDSDVEITKEDKLSTQKVAEISEPVSVDEERPSNGGALASVDQPIVEE